MAVRPSKCVFFKPSIKFLGHIINSEGSKPTDENINVIRFFDRPRTVRNVRSFLGTVNFYRKFIHDVTSIAAPLYDLIKKGQTKITWTEECNKAFILLKEALVTAPVLVYPDFSRPFYIKCDASNIGIGGVLEQEVDGEAHPIAYCSRKLNHAEQNYSVIEKEALAIVFVLAQFRYLIYGYNVFLQSDHKPLSYVFKLKDSNQRLIRWLLHIQDFRLKIQHIPGKENFVADMLSRSDEDSEILNVNAVKSNFEPITNERVKIAQLADPLCLEIINKVKNNEFKDEEFVIDEQNVLLKKIHPTRIHGWRFRVVAPKALQNEILFNYHDRVYSGHLSLPKVLWKIKQVFTWDSMFSDVASYVKSCDKCQRRNTARLRAPFQPIQAPSYPMERLNVDLLGPFETTKNKMKYLILYSDSMSRMVFGSPLPNIEAATVAKDYVQNVFSLHGGSREILTDRGTQFTSSIFQNLCKRLGIKHLTTSSYRPTCNGIAERINQRVLRILAHICNKFYSNWDEMLPYVLYAIRTSVHRSIGESPFYVFHGFDPIDPVIEASHSFRETFESVSDYVEKTMSDIELVRSEVTKNLTTASEQNCNARNAGRKLREFSVGQQVLYLDSASYAGKNRKLRPRYKGPFRITTRLGMVNYRIRNVSDPKEIRTSHVDKLKFYYPRLMLDDVDKVSKSKRGDRINKEDNRCLYDINVEQDGENFVEIFDGGDVFNRAVNARDNVVQNSEQNIETNNINDTEITNNVNTNTNDLDLINFDLSENSNLDVVNEAELAVPVIPETAPSLPVALPPILIGEETSSIPPAPIIENEIIIANENLPGPSVPSDVGVRSRFNERYPLRSNPSQPVRYRDKNFIYDVALIIDI